MTFQEFKTSVSSSTAPSQLGPALLALWHDARGNWDEAHRLAQDIHDETGAWVHAYLHRKEGDLGNARYWYRHAGRPPANVPLEAEWEHIATELLGKPGPPPGG
jgi:hypothetical protein